MIVKKGQRVTLWNGDFGKVIAVLENKARIRLDDGTNKYCAFEQIVAAMDTVTPKQVKFREAKKKLAQYKKKSDVSESQTVSGTIEFPYKEQTLEIGYTIKFTDGVPYEDITDVDMWGIGDDIQKDLAENYGDAIDEMILEHANKQLEDHNKQGSKKAGHPKETDTAYVVGDILTPTEGNDLYGYVDLIYDGEDTVEVSYKAKIINGETEIVDRWIDDVNEDVAKDILTTLNEDIDKLIMEDIDYDISSKNKYVPGTKVVFTGGGVADGKEGVIVDRSEVKTNERGVPVDDHGAYNPVDWDKEVAIRFDDGSFTTAPRNYIKVASKTAGHPKETLANHKKITKQQAEQFYKDLRTYMSEIGATSVDRSSGESWTISTIAGNLTVIVHDDEAGSPVSSIYTKFDDVDAASKVLDNSNPYSGKWNFHGYDPVANLEQFQNDLDVILGESNVDNIETTAGHPKETDTKYAVGDILTPVKGNDKTHQIHVLDVIEDGKTYILEQRPMNDLTDKDMDNSEYGVRYEVAVSKLDKDKEWRRYGSRKTAMGEGMDTAATEALAAEIQGYVEHDVDGKGDKGVIDIHGPMWYVEDKAKYEEIEGKISAFKIDRPEYEMYLGTDASGYDYWIKQQDELNYIMLTIRFKGDSMEHTDQLSSDVAEAVGEMDFIAVDEYDYSKFGSKQAGRWSMKQMEEHLAEKNEEDGTAFELGGAYGEYELWANGNRLDAGSLKDVYQAWIKNRFNEKYKKQVTSAGKVPGVPDGTGPLGKGCGKGNCDKKEKNAAKKTAVKEYAIWGVPEGQTEDTLLLAEPCGKKITDKGDADRYVKLMEDKYKATKVRIQELDLSEDLDWMKEISGKKALKGLALKNSEDWGFKNDDELLSYIVEEVGVHPDDIKEIFGRPYKKESIKNPVRTQKDYGELEWKLGELQAVKEVDNNVILSFKDCDATYDVKGRFISAINGAGKAIKLATNFQKEFGLIVANIGVKKIHAAITQRTIARKLPGNVSRGSRMKIASLRKKAERLGNWGFDTHDPVWKLEAGENGKQKIRRC